MRVIHGYHLCLQRAQQKLYDELRREFKEESSSNKGGEGDSDTAKAIRELISLSTKGVRVFVTSYITTNGLVDLTRQTFPAMCLVTYSNGCDSEPSTSERRSGESHGNRCGEKNRTGVSNRQKCDAVDEETSC